MISRRNNAEWAKDRHECGDFAHIAEQHDADIAIAEYERLLWAQYAHRPLFKVVINTCLRFVQRRSTDPYLVASVMAVVDGRAVCIGYTFRRVELMPV